MEGLVFFITALVVFVGFIVLAIVKSVYKNKVSLLKPANYIMLGTFLAGTILAIPIISLLYSGGNVSFKSVLLSINFSIRLFVADADFDRVAIFTAFLDGAYGSAYEIFYSIIFVTAPVLTFSFILSFFNNLSSSVKLLFSRWKDVYVFSDLNERSLSLAKDIRDKNKGAAIIFADIIANKDETNDLLEQANVLGAIIFKKSVSAINYKLISKSKKLTFFVISDNEEENVSKSYDLIENYKNRKNCELYLFSMTKQSQLFLDSIDARHEMKIRRVHESLALVNGFLYENGSQLFTTAHATEDGLKVVSAVVVGMGIYGTEVAKTLPWFCQMSGYRFKMNVFSMDSEAQAKFTALCPEYMNPKCNGVYVDGEAQYDIKIHAGIDYNTETFGEALKNIPDASFVFIAVGSDEENISCAIKVRTYFERFGVRPKIVAVVYDAEKIKRIKGASSIDGRSYGIDYVGSLSDLYSVKLVINSELEEKALKVHMRYPASNKTLEEHMRTFWTNEYNYNSSCASALHNKVRVDMQISGAEKEEKDLTDQELQVITLIEHRRWNAYVRSCGYVYSGSPEKSSRNDLAKVHNCLIPFEQLTDEYKQMDTDIGVKK
ncbi:MAG: hypothetical protein II988_06375 [Clostridia bacterium]|nr:hypothetical protein [Clostridia bacterium]